MFAGLNACGALPTRLPVEGADRPRGRLQHDGVRRHRGDLRIHRPGVCVSAHVDGSIMIGGRGSAAIEPSVVTGPVAAERSGAVRVCLYWLHTHDETGIIHIEAPPGKTFTLRQLFAIWQQPLDRSQVGPDHGVVTAFVDGRRFRGDPRGIPLGDHTLIPLDLGTPVVPPQPFEFPAPRLRSLTGRRQAGAADAAKK